MKPLVCLYCEGNDTKLAVVEKEKGSEKLKVLRTAAVGLVTSSANVDLTPVESQGGVNLEGGDLALEGMDAPDATIDTDIDTTSLNAISDTLEGLNLSNHIFIPGLTEPALYYHIYDGVKESKESKLRESIVDEIHETKNMHVEKESMDYTELSDNSLLTAFIAGEVNCINLINSVAQMQGKRYFKIPTVKSAEVSLAYYVAKRKKFFPDDQSLIVYIGKEYSKLIFLQGRKLKHIGSTLDIGTLNLHTYDVYFSKILLEMENGGISSLDNIIVCGEDDSENLILSFYGTFPEANVSRLEFDDFDLSSLDEETKEKFSAFSVPVAIATDYYDEQIKEHSGLNILPKYVKDEQKVFQFGWHSYIILPLLFVAAFFITQQILQNDRQLAEMEQEITEKTILMRQNQETLARIAELEGKIAGFDQTQAILDSATVGTGVWNNVLQKMSQFIGGKQNMWLTRVARDNTSGVVVEGYAVSKFVLTDFAYFIESATLRSVVNEKLRDLDVYKFNLNFNPIVYQDNNISEVIIEDKNNEQEN